MHLRAFEVAEADSVERKIAQQFRVGLASSLVH
jgi:hypothetical protein